MLKIKVKTIKNESKKDIIYVKHTTKEKETIGERLVLFRHIASVILKDKLVTKEDLIKTIKKMEV